MELYQLIRNFLLGKNVLHTNSYGRKVTRKVEDVQLRRREEVFGESNAANDWWPPSATIKSIFIKFDDGSSKEFDFDSDIQIV